MDPNNKIYDEELTSKYFGVMKKIATDGITFKGKTVLVTGCGKDSIGLELVKGLIRGGARVYATTSHFSAAGSQLYQSVYDHHGAKESELVVLPFNQASIQVLNLSILSVIRTSTPWSNTCTKKKRRTSIT